MYSFENFKNCWGKKRNKNCDLFKISILICTAADFYHSELKEPGKKYQATDT